MSDEHFEILQRDGWIDEIMFPGMKYDLKNDRVSCLLNLIETEYLDTMVIHYILDENSLLVLKVSGIKIHRLRAITMMN